MLDSNTSFVAPHGGAGNRIGEGDAAWPARPWLMAVLGGFSGLIFWLFFDKWDLALGNSLSGALSAAVMIAAACFILSVEQRRWTWSLFFALFWGMIGGLIYLHASMGVGAREQNGWPFVSILLTILIATPFFQAQRDGANAPDGLGGVKGSFLWRLPYDRLHDHAWIDAVLGAAALVFIGICFAMLALIGGLFSLIGIEFISNLFSRDWFMFGLAGAAFGAAVGLLRERDRLVSVLQRLVMIVLSVLAPILAAALLLFLISLPLTGLSGLWDSGFSAAGLLLGVAAAGLLLANSVIGNDRAEFSNNRLMRGSAAVLAVAVLPLAVLAGAAFSLRIDQYGWTPSRLWGVTAVLVAIAYGAAGGLAVLRGRWDFADRLRSAQKKLAAAVMALAFILAMPIVDFGAISARDQWVRLNKGAVSVQEFDWAAMAFQFGPKGREILRRLARTGTSEQAKAAQAALKADSRYGIENLVKRSQFNPLEERLYILPEGASLPDGLRKIIGADYVCGSAAACTVAKVSANYWAVLVQDEQGGAVTVRWFAPQEQAWVESGPATGAGADPAVENSKRRPLGEAQIEVREVRRRQIFIDGQPSGTVFE